MATLCADSENITFYTPGDQAFWAQIHIDPALQTNTRPTVLFCFKDVQYCQYAPIFCNLAFHYNALLILPKMTLFYVVASINNTCNNGHFIAVVYTELAGTVGHSHTYDDLHDVIYYVQVPEDYRLRLFALTGSHVSQPSAFKVDF